MNLELSAEDRAFRDEVRAFLQQSLPDYLRQAGRHPTSVFTDKDWTACPGSGSSMPRAGSRRLAEGARRARLERMQR